MSLILGLHRAPRKLFAYSALPAIECQICNIFHSLLQFTGSNSADVVCASETEVGEREEKAIKQDASHHDLCVGENRTKAAWRVGNKLGPEQQQICDVTSTGSSHLHTPDTGLLGVSKKEKGREGVSTLSANPGINGSLLCCSQIQPLFPLYPAITIFKQSTYRLHRCLSTQITTADNGIRMWQGGCALPKTGKSRARLRRAG
ncbi:uncharacterized protein LOC128643545 isoform X1 [Bombina bombina]|uniref:uncharacterized protein LOC128643545 isoform X1 n=1 Tax=Bombina bombina TaxID=8345 RepID=UPI00235AE2C9|nr:uncharacterized protein LOC128643545 isoform X1 [Bombina bombina]